MTPAELNAALDVIENGDPVAELAARLIAAGMTEEELHTTAGPLRERARPLALNIPAR